MKVPSSADRIPLVINYLTKIPILCPLATLSFIKLTSIIHNHHLPHPPSSWIVLQLIDHHAKYLLSRKVGLGSWEFCLKKEKAFGAEEVHWW